MRLGLYSDVMLHLAGSDISHVGLHHSWVDCQRAVAVQASHLKPSRMGQPRETGLVVSLFLLLHPDISGTVFLLISKIKQKRLRAGFNFTLFNRDLNLPDERS